MCYDYANPDMIDLKTHCCGLAKAPCDVNHVATPECCGGNDLCNDVTGKVFADDTPRNTTLPKIFKFCGKPTRG